MADLQAIKAEMAKDKSLAAKSDVDVADVLNKSQRVVPRESITGGIIASCIVASELAAMNTAVKAYVMMLVQCGSDIPITPTLKAELTGALNGAPTTKANLAAAIKRTGTYGEEIGAGANITPSDVANARK